MKKIKILIVDDHQLIRHSFKSLLSNMDGMEVIGDVATGEEAIEFTRTHHPDVILMDLRMPGIGGLTATQKITENYGESRILVISSCDTEPFPSTALAGGATGFISKSSSNEELLSAIRAVAAGVQYLSPKIAKAMATKNFDMADGSPFGILSNTELRVALMLIKGIKGQNIAEKMQIDSKLVSAYRSRIYIKFSVKTDVALALLAARYGLVDDTPLLNG
jgi:two-component system, NarL family, invasion response regulator UvrY